MRGQTRAAPEEDPTGAPRLGGRPLPVARPGAAREDYVAAVRDRLIDTLRDAQGRWTAPYVRLRFDARRAAA